MEPNLSQALHLLNGDTLHGKIGAGKLIQEQLAEKRSPEQIIDDLYLRCLTRRPTPEETQKLVALVAAQENVQQGLEDVFWALLNSREFLFNH